MAVPSKLNFLYFCALLFFFDSHLVPSSVSRNGKLELESDLLHRDKARKTKINEDDKDEALTVLPTNV